MPVPKLGFNYFSELRGVTRTVGRDTVSIWQLSDVRLSDVRLSDVRLSDVRLSDPRGSLAEALMVEWFRATELLRGGWRR
ncbi:MAG: hypothetical protein ACI9OJ_000465 [Myxococcota bacterium]|jgi:hypothetical protein